MLIYSNLERPIKKICIYLLSDPDTNEPKYIGLTTNGFTRITAHYSSCTRKTKDNPYVKKWIKSLKENNKIFKVEYLEYFDKDSILLDEAEQFYIMYFKFLGFNIINYEFGGRWNGPLTEEDLKRRSENTKRQMSNPASREICRKANIGNKNCVGNKKTKESIFQSRSKICHIIRELQTNTDLYGISDVAKYLNCSPGKVRRYFKKDYFEIDNKRFQVIKLKSNYSEELKNNNRKHSYEIEDEFGNVYKSVKEAAEKIGCSNRALTHYVQGHTKTANGKKYKVYRYGKLIKE